uniref:Cytochrome c oxidase subunit 2 n=1 Tax=Elasmosoma sp. QL-2014 TaxID=1491720 RepID=A0A0U1X173_9HYME|nr:cytochrome c oxidase subunit II [Elasmosoma sp. QL-2014]
MCMWNMMNFQDSGSYEMFLLISLYDFIMVILFMILLFIFYIIIWFFFSKYFSLNILHNQLLELIWTLLPMLILIFMAIPSLKILYIIEEMISPFLSIKILGHQWYWSYEYVDFLLKDYDSFMMVYEKEGMFRLLDVDNRLVVPYKVFIRGLVSSVDVIHSWAVAGLGIKVDAIPGRLNQFMMVLNRCGLFFGQCSEICGLNHSFMPIVVESVSFNLFMSWLLMN